MSINDEGQPRCCLSVLGVRSTDKYKRRYVELVFCRAYLSVEAALLLLLLLEHINAGVLIQVAQPQFSPVKIGSM